MRQARSARKLTVASVIKAANAALRERSDARPLPQPASQDPAERSAAKELDSVSAAYIDAYIEADEDVRTASSLPNRLEAMRVAGVCGAVSDLARQGELPEDLANAFVRGFKEEAAKDLSSEDPLELDQKLAHSAVFYALQDVVAIGRFARDPVGNTVPDIDVAAV